MKKIFVPLLGSFCLFACQLPREKKIEKAPEVVSLLGTTYFEPERSKESQQRLDSALEVAKENLHRNQSEENYIWYGRRLGYLSRFNQAIEVLSEGLDKYPKSYRLLRHRGHRYISMRLFDRAIADLTKASQLMPSDPPEIEPDGAPNKLNIPLSSTQFNVWYHLALAYYLKGEFENAEKAYSECLKSSYNDDLMVATVDWMYMTYKRLEKNEAADSLLQKIRDDMTIVENDSYYNRLKMYQGKLQPENLLTVDTGSGDYDLSIATQGYGVGNWYLYHGDTTKAIEIFEKVVSGKSFASFGFIASESELARMRNSN